MGMIEFETGPELEHGIHRVTMPVCTVEKLAAVLSVLEPVAEFVAEIHLNPSFSVVAITVPKGRRDEIAAILDRVKAIVGTK